MAAETITTKTVSTKTNFRTNTTYLAATSIINGQGSSKDGMKSNQIHNNKNDDLNTSKLTDVHNSEHEMNCSKTKPKTSKQILQEIAMLTNGTTPRHKYGIGDIESQQLTLNSKSAFSSN